jgi:hypothetical protein
MKQCQQYDVGFKLSYTILDENGAPRDLSGISAAFLLLESPSGKRSKFVATVAGSVVSYTTRPLDLPEWGQWRAQVELFGSAEDTRTRVEDLWVASNADAPQLVLRPDPVATVASARTAALAGV